MNIRWLALVSLWSFSAAADWNALVDGVDLRCTQPGASVLSCDYRAIGGGTAAGIEAKAGEIALEVGKVEPYPWDGARTAILVLIDTSDPARQAVVEMNSRQVVELLKAAMPHHHFGLSSFDSRLRIESPMGTPPADISAAARRFKATGMTTELYRSVLEAVQALSRVEADRRSVIVFSDGQAEDRAYFQADVVNAARKAGVTINTLGFARSVPLSVALQTLRRLSEETGGLYLEAGPQLELSPGFAGKLLGSIDSGGRFSVGLAPLLSDPPAAPPKVRLTIRTGTGTATAEIPVSLPAAARAPFPPAARESPAPAATAPEVRVVRAAAPRTGIDLWLWYGVPLALIVLIVLTLITLFLISRRGAAPQTRSTPAAEERKALAYLIVQDEKRTRFPITRTIWRIGRSRDNELVLDDNSVSRRHAEIHRSENGMFTLHDRNSLNGVFVNTVKVEKAPLSEGDIIEIGDLVLRFTESSADDQFQEQTSIQHTRQPQIS